MQKFLTIPFVFSLLVPSLGFAAETFEEKDFQWDPLLTHYKRIVIAGVNRLARENPDCATLDPGTLQYEGGTPDDPSFVVTCGEPGHTIHAHFSKTDVTGDPSSDIPLEEKNKH